MLICQMKCDVVLHNNLNSHRSLQGLSRLDNRCFMNIRYARSSSLVSPSQQQVHNKDASRPHMMTGLMDSQASLPCAWASRLFQWREISSLGTQAWPMLPAWQPSESMLLAWMDHMQRSKSGSQNKKTQMVCMVTHSKALLRNLDM